MKKLLVLFIILLSCSSFQTKDEKCPIADANLCDPEVMEYAKNNLNCKKSFQIFIDNETHTSARVICFPIQFVSKESMKCMNNFLGNYVCFKR